MAEIVNLFEVNIDTDKAIKDLAQSQKSVDALKKEIKELQQAEGDNSKAIAEATAQLKVEQAELRTNTRLTQNALAATKQQTGSIEQLRSQLAVVSIEWQRLTKEERENTERGQQLTKQKKELTDALKAEEAATGDTRRNVGNYGESIKEAIDGTGLFNSSLLTLAANPVVLTITAIVGLFKLFQAAANRSEKASANLNKIFAIFQGVLDGILNALTPIVEFLTDKLVEAFNNPKEAIIDLGNAILENLINRAKSITVIWGAVQKLFEGDFKGAAKQAADGFLQLTTGVENATDKVLQAGEAVVDFAKTTITEIDKAIDINQRLANSERELLRIQKEFELQQLTFQKNAELQRQIRDDESKSIEERIQANEQLGNILDQQLQKELNLARTQLQFAQLRRQADGDTLETQEAIYDAQIKIAEIEERIAGQRSEQLTNTNSLLKEQEDLEIAALERDIQIQEEELNRQIEAANRSAEIEAERIAMINEARAVDFENRMALAQSNEFAMLELEREGLEQRRLQEIEFAEKIGADVNLINEKYQQANIALDRAEFQAKASLASDFANNIAQIAGENTKVGKAAAIASTTINTYQAATGAYAALAPIPIVGPGLGIAAAAAAVKAGLDNVKKILSVKSGLPGESGVGSATVSSGGASSAPTTSRRANIVDDVNAGIISRNTDTIGGNNETRYVSTLVTDDVTVKQNQEMSNNRTATV